MIEQHHNRESLFATVRRGYDPLAVDEHISELEAIVIKLREELEHKPTLAEGAGAQVQSIVSAAETSAQEMTDEAADQARKTKLLSEQEADRTREEAERQAAERVSRVNETSDHLQASTERIESSLHAQLDDLRVGLSRLVEEVDGIRTNINREADAALADGRLSTSTWRSAEVAQATGAGDAGHEPADDLDALRHVADTLARDGSTREETARHLKKTFEIVDQIEISEIVDAAYAEPV